MKNGPIFYNIPLMVRITNRGDKTSIRTDGRELSHKSFIETDKYIIDLGYRLRVFGDRDDQKTEEEIINITKKSWFYGKVN